MLQDFMDKSEMVSSLLKTMGKATLLSGECILMVQDELDTVIQQFDPKAGEGTVRLLKEMKRYLNYVGGDKYIDLFDVLPSEYTPRLAMDMSGESKTVISVLPEKVEVPATSYYYSNSYPRHQRYGDLYVSPFMSRRGTSGKEYNTITIYKPVQFDPKKDIVIDAWGFTEYIPEKYQSNDATKNREVIYFPFGHDMEQWWEGKVVEIDGLRMGKVALVKHIVKAGAKK